MLNLGHGIFQKVMEKVMESHGILTGRKCTNPDLIKLYTPNANMADNSVGARDECVKVRLVRPRCFVLTMLPLKNVASWMV